MSTLIKAYEKGMNLEKGVWFAVIAQSGKPTEIVYYNEADGKEEYDFDFKAFAECVIDDNLVLTDNKESKIDSIFSYYQAGKAEEVEEIDEEARKVYKDISVDAQIINVYEKEDLSNPDLVKYLVEKVEKELVDFEDNLRDSFADGLSYQKDPYAYYGVSRSDFIGKI